jgi:hypothetical protein
MFFSIFYNVHIFKLTSRQTYNCFHWLFLKKINQDNFIYKMKIPLVCAIPAIKTTRFSYFLRFLFDKQGANLLKLHYFCVLFI